MLSVRREIFGVTPTPLHHLRAESVSGAGVASARTPERSAQVKSVVVRTGFTLSTSYSVRVVLRAIHLNIFVFGAMRARRFACHFVDVALTQKPDATHERG